MVELRFSINIRNTRKPLPRLYDREMEMKKHDL
jgi:hypothetical protein